MTKAYINWHKENLKNRKLTRNEYILEMERIKNNILEIESDISFLEYQIQEAEKEGKMLFDAERYRKPKKK